MRWMTWRAISGRPRPYLLGITCQREGHAAQVHLGGRRDAGVELGACLRHLRGPLAVGLLAVAPHDVVESKTSKHVIIF